MMKKKIIFIVFVLIFIIIFILSRDFFSFTKNGTNYYINNEEYSYSIESYNIIKQLSHDELSQGKVTLSEEYSLIIENVDFIEDNKYKFNFVIHNDQGDFNQGCIFYLYSFEEVDRDFEIELLIGNTSYSGSLQSEGPFNKDGFYFSVIFDNVSASILSEGTISISFQDAIITCYERN